MSIHVKLKPFEDKDCVKCGHHESSLRFMAAETPIVAELWGDTQAMIRTCTCCGFSWGAQTLDAEKRKARESYL